MSCNIAAVFLDYLCNYSCDHCSVGSSPHTKYEMSPELLDSVIDQVLDIPSFRVLVFTGGEPTLRKRSLFHGIRRGAEAGLVTRVVTNGWWASSEESAQKWVDEMVDAGLRELNTSYDEYHLAFGKDSRFLNMTKAALAHEDLVFVIGSIENPESNANFGGVPEKLAAALDIDEHELRDRIVFLYDSPTSTGTASVEIRRKGEKWRPRSQFGCEHVIQTISFHPDSSVKACCGHAVFYAPDLTLGYLEEMPLAEILDGSTRNIIYWLIHTMGPDRILDRLGIDPGTRTMCDACHVLLTDHREEFHQYVLDHADELIVRDVLFSPYLRNLADAVGGISEQVATRGPHGSLDWMLTRS